MNLVLAFFIFLFTLLSEKIDCNLLNFKDQCFGELKYNKEFNWYETTILYKKSKINFYISLDEVRDRKAAINTAKEICKKLSPLTEKAQNFAADNLLNLKNETWLDEEGIVTRDSFIERMVLESITVYPQGNSEFWFHDGDLFWGHSIRVLIEKDGMPSYTNIEG